MKFGRISGLILLLAYAQIAVAQTKPDTMWAFKDDIPDSALFYFNCYTTDTFPDNRNQFFHVDTGDKYDGMYINYDYQFTATNETLYDTSIFFNTAYSVWDTLPDTTYRHPGYAGFKVFWDNGFVKWALESYDTMYFAHKGPLPGHKVKMIWAQGGQCGGPIKYQYCGQFKSSATWTIEKIAFPPGFIRGDAEGGNFELRMLICNDSSITTSPTSPRGCLKLDNIGFLKNKALVIKTQPQSQAVEEGSSVTFSVVVAGTAPTYQWRKDTIPIPGATSSTYTIPSAKPGDEGNYTVVVTNSVGSFTSTAATLTVNAKEKKNCGCGSGTGLAFIPPIFFKAMALRNRKKKNPKAKA